MLGKFSECRIVKILDHCVT